MTRITPDNPDNPDNPETPEIPDTPDNSRTPFHHNSAKNPAHLSDDSLLQALERLDAGAEPPMPDLVAASVVQGRRIRHRRRVSAVLGSTAAVLALAAGALTLPSLTGPRLDRPAAPMAPATVPGPSTMPGIRYPSASALRAVTEDDSLSIAEASPADAVVRGHYVRVTGTGAGGGFLLYAAVFPTVTTASETGAALPSGTCATLAGDPISTPWSDHTRCLTAATRSGDGSEVLSYTMTDQRGARTAGEPATGFTAVGTTRLTKDGWTVQVVAGTLDRAAQDSPAQPESASASGSNSGSDAALSDASDRMRALALGLATDDRLLDLVLDRTG